MVSINLYQSGKLDITLEFPTSWNELLPDEIVFVSKTLIEQNEVNARQTRPKILKFIIESRARASGKKLPKSWMMVVDKEQMVIDGYPLLDFIFKTNNLTAAPAPLQLTYRFISKTFYPVPFSDITCGEFEDAEIAANNFSRQPSEQLLASLACILFRQKKHGKITPYVVYNFKTAEYTSYKKEKFEKKFLQLKTEQLYAIYIWYVGCRSQLAEMFPNVYSGGSPDVDPLAFTNCIHAGAGPKNGNRNQIRTMKLYEFMYDMEQEAIKAEELKREYERLRRTG